MTTHANLRELTVNINGQLVGHLRESDDLWAFEYEPTWMASPVGFDLSPGLPRTLAQHTDGASQRPVQWYFDNLLPEEALRTLIAREAALPADDAFALLAYFGAESAGSLVLSAAPAPGFPPVPSLPMGLKPLSPADLSHRIANLPHASLTKEAPKRMSLAGAQHKMLVVMAHTHDGETRAMANDKANWPGTLLAFTLGDARTFAGVARTHLLAAGQTLGLTLATATRELDRLIQTVPTDADKLAAEIERGAESEIARSPAPQITQAFIGGEMYLLRAIRHIVIADMVRQLRIGEPSL